MCTVLFVLAYTALASGEQNHSLMLIAVVFSGAGFMALCALVPSPFMLIRAIILKRNIFFIAVFGIGTMVLLPLVWTFVTGVLVGIAFIGG